MVVQKIELVICTIQRFPKISDFFHLGFAGGHRAIDFSKLSIPLSNCSIKNMSKKEFGLNIMTTDNAHFIEITD